MDAWTRLRDLTQARIGLGRAGDGLPTSELLKFQLGHAQARDAVHGVPDFGALSQRLGDRPHVRVESAATSRPEYLLRPDLGRQLSRASRDRLERRDCDLVLVVADGLSSTAVDDHALPLLASLIERLPDWRLAPIVLATNARVALGDEIGEALGAQMVAVLIGERPGLTVANSLGAYLTWNPRTGRKDSERNCVSNIHTHGLGYEEAAHKIAWILREARSRQLTGVLLKENSERILGNENPAL